MIQNQTRVAFDTQVVSYFLQANQSGYDPTIDGDMPLRQQRVAAFRLWMYTPNPAIVPTVFAECSSISEPDKQREHFNWIAYHFHEVLPSWLNAEQVEDRSRQLGEFHAGKKRQNDCRIVAECEQPGSRVGMLATFDSELIRNLGGKAAIVLATPDDCLKQLALTPNVRLHPEHPHSGATWWRLPT